VLSNFSKRNIFTKKGSHQNPVFKRNKVDQKIIDEAVNLYGEPKTKIPFKTKEYLNEYGFEDLVSNVARWTDIDGIVVREYSIDRLWLGRYIDYLDKAREFLKFKKSEKAIGQKRISDLKKSNKK
jgi:hypothetical protein